MNSDQLLHALTDCAKASTHEPDAETINAAIVRIRELEAQLAAYAEFRRLVYKLHEHINQCGICRAGGICQPFGAKLRTDYAVAQMNLDEALK